MSNNDLLVWEHKCRKCGLVTEMFYDKREPGEEGKKQWLRFAEHLSDMVTTPRCQCCDTCKRHTVHNVISYSGPFKT